MGALKIRVQYPIKSALRFVVPENIGVPWCFKEVNQVEVKKAITSTSLRGTTTIGASVGSLEHKVPNLYLYLEECSSPDHASDGMLGTFE